MGRPMAQEVGDRLVAHLRAAFAAPRLRLAGAPRALGGGYDTILYALALEGAPPAAAGPLVLRVFREPGSATRAGVEAALHAAVSAQGFPAPRIVLLGDDEAPLGRAFLLMERLPGRPLVGDPPGPGILRMPRLLAESQRALHALDAEPIRRAVEAAGLPAARLSPEVELAAAAERVLSLGLGGLAAGVAWLKENPPPPAERTVPCHGDFHPLNVLATRGRVTGVVDWTPAHVKLADPAYDVGSTLALLGHGPVDVPAPFRGLAERIRAALVRAYLRAYTSAHPLEPRALAYYRSLRCLLFLVEAGEHRLADLGRRARPDKPTAFGAARTIAGVVEDFRAETGVAVSLP